MSKNVYDIFRDVQEKRSTTYNQRSAALIIDGKMSKTIYHKRNEKFIHAALLFSQDEGPDEIWVFSFIKDQLQKGDYFTYEDNNFLIIEENKIFDPDINHKKQKAVECNVSFTINNEIFNGYFQGGLRRIQKKDFENDELLLPQENPLLILPSTAPLEINSEFMIEGKPWRVIEYDKITNKGVGYFYLERGINYTTEEVPEVEIQSLVVPENETFTQEPEPMLRSFAAESSPNEEEALNAMIEYSFSTEEGYFVATPKVEIISRKNDLVKFKVPFGINQVSITTKLNGINVEKLYKVVL